VNPRGGVAALLLALSMPLVLGSAGCVGLRRAATPAPRLFVAEDVVRVETGTACGADLNVATGALPADAIPLSRYHVTTSQPVPLPQVLDLLVVHARHRCAAGVRVLRVDVADGATGVIAAEAVAYALPTAP